MGPVWANWSRFVSETSFGLLGLLMSRMSTSSSSRSSTSTTNTLPVFSPCASRCAQAKAECVWFAFVCGTPPLWVPFRLVKSPAPSTSFFGWVGLVTSTSEIPPTPVVPPGHHSFWYTSTSPLNEELSIDTTCEPSPENVSTWLGMYPAAVGAVGLQMSTIWTPPRSQVGS